MKNEPNNRGVLIVFEGLDGVGKSTQVQLLQQHLTDCSVPVTVSREPGGTPLGYKLRDLLLHEDRTLRPIGALAELFLFQADHEQLLEEVVCPALDRGEVVVLDRYLYSSVAYQVAGHQLQFALDAEYHAVLTQLMRPRVQPDRVFWLDLLPDLILSHGNAERRRTSEYTDLIESRPLEYFQRVRTCYDTLWSEDHAHWVHLEAQRSKASIANSVWGLHVEPLLVQHGLLKEASR